MAEYAFPKDLLGGIKDRWDAVPARQGFELPEEHTLLELLEVCYHASLRTDERRPFIVRWHMLPSPKCPTGRCCVSSGPCR